MYGMSIENFHSYIDFGLVPTSKPLVNLPSPKLEYLEIPGRHGSIDITESLTKEVIYEMRVGSFEFIVSNSKKWDEIHSRLISLVHGKKVKIILDSEKEYVYQGRRLVREFKSDKNYSLITLDYKLEPYKYSVSDIKDDGDIIYRLEDIVIKNSKSITLPFDSDMTLVPEFNNKTEEIITLSFGEEEYKLKKGINRFPEIRGRKDLKLTFTGSSIIDIAYKRGWL